MPYDRKDTVEHLDNGRFDIAMTGYAITTDAAMSVSFTEPYMNATLAIACRDHDRDRWGNAASIRKIKSAKIAVAGNNAFFTKRIKRRYPKFEIVEIPSVKDYFEGKLPEVEALVMSAEGGSAWSLLHPSFCIVIPKPATTAIPVAYPVAGDDPKFLRFLDRWVEFKLSDGTVRELTDYWIYGKSAKPKERRWSIAQDVLGWFK